MGPWALLPTVTLSPWAISDRVFSLSPPCACAPVSSLPPLALLPCLLPVFWPCSGPSTLGGARPCAHGTCLDQALSLLPPFCLPCPSPRVSPASLRLPAQARPAPELSPPFPSRSSQSFGTTQLRQSPVTTGVLGPQPSLLLGACRGWVWSG